MNDCKQTDQGRCRLPNLTRFQQLKETRSRRGEPLREHPAAEKAAWTLLRRETPEGSPKSEFFRGQPDRSPTGSRPRPQPDRDDSLWKNHRRKRTQVWQAWQSRNPQCGVTSASPSRFLPESQDDSRFTSDHIDEGDVSPRFFGNLATTTKWRRNVFEEGVSKRSPGAHSGSRRDIGLPEVVQNAIKANEITPILRLGSFGARSVRVLPTNQADHRRTKQAMGSFRRAGFCVARDRSHVPPPRDDCSPACGGGLSPRR